MNQLPFERTLAGWMADEAAGAPEAIVEHVLAATAQSRPSPRWLAVLRESPMRTNARVTVGVPSRGVLLAAVLALTLAAVTALAVGAVLLLQRQPDASGDWSGFHGDASHSGIGLQGPVGRPVLDWQFHALSGVLDVSIVGDQAIFAGDDGVIHAVSVDRGIERWTARNAHPPVTGPFVADGRVYLADHSGAISALAATDGSTIWTSAPYATPSRLISVDGTVYFGTADGLLVAVDGATGSEKWRLSPSPAATAVHAPAAGGGLIYAGTEGGGYVAVDAATHQVAWQADTGGDSTGSAVVSGGIAYLGTSVDATSGSLRAFDAKTGRLLWVVGDRRQLPGFSNGLAISANDDGSIAGIDTATGSVRWQIAVQGNVRSPVAVGGIAYIGADQERRIYAVDAASGRQLWQFDVDGSINCCIAVAKGAVFVGTLAGSVYSIGGDGAAVAPLPFPSLAPTAVPTAAPSATPPLIPPSVAWSTDLRDAGIAPVCQIAVDPTGRIWVPEAATGKLAIVDAGGALIEEWGEPGSDSGQFAFTRANGDCYGTLAFEPDGSFYVLDVGNRRIQEFDKQRRFVRQWGSFGMGQRQFSDPVGLAIGADGTVWVLDDSREVVEHYDRTGHVLGSFDPFSNTVSAKGANSLAIGPNGHFYVTQIQPNQIAEFDADGTIIGTFGRSAFPFEQPTHMAIDPEGRVFVTQGPGRDELPGVTAFAADGTVLGGFGPVGGEGAGLSFPAGIALDGAGSLYVMDSDPASARLLKIRLDPPLAP